MHHRRSPQHLHHLLALILSARILDRTASPAAPTSKMSATAPTAAASSTSMPSSTTPEPLAPYGNFRQPSPMIEPVSFICIC